MIWDAIVFELLELRLSAKVGKLANLLVGKTAAGKNILILETAYFLREGFSKIWLKCSGKCYAPKDPTLAPLPKVQDFLVRK